MFSLFYFPLSYHLSFLFFFNDTATTEIYTLSLHDALPILGLATCITAPLFWNVLLLKVGAPPAPWKLMRSEGHTSELQSHFNLVCRLMLEQNYVFPLKTLPLSSLTPPPPFSRIPWTLAKPA